MRYINSTAVTGADYDANTGVLTLLVGNRLFEYTGVPAATYTGLLEADSAGRFYNSNIRSKFEVR